MAFPGGGPPVDRSGYGRALAIVAVTTGAAWAMFRFVDLENLVMVYLLAIVLVARRHGRGPSVLAAVSSVAAFDFFFVPPYYTFAVADFRYVLTFAVMLAVALAMGGMTARIRAQAETARAREARATALYAMSRELAGARGVEAIVAIAARHIGDVFRGEVGVFLPDGGGSRLAPAVGAPSTVPVDANERALIAWVYEHRAPAGLGTATLPASAALYLPLVASRGPVGAMSVLPADRRAIDAPDERHQLETFANQTAVALERAQLAGEAEASRLRAESEQLRNSLLSSVSHDLRTPLAAITGAASTLLESGETIDTAMRRELLESVHEEADRLNRLVQNLLEMTRLQSGTLALRRDWHPLEEVIGAALSRLGKRLADRRVVTRIPEDLPLVAIDDVLIEQVLINLLDNAVKHTGRGTPITIVATATDRSVTVEVTDRGPGLPRGEEDEVFEKFYRGAGAGGRGAGLGLAICKAIVQAHGGRIWAQNVPEGGAAFFFTLPNTETPPVVMPER